MVERDPLDELRSAWRDLEPPQPEQALEQADSQTRAVLGWMREAWRQLEAPEVRVPRLPRLVRRRPRWLVPAAAAVLLLGASLGLRALLEPPSRDGTGTQVADWTGDGSTDPAPTPREPGPVLVAAADPGRMVLRSGPVELVLLTPLDQDPEDSR